jgi:hypothetical protein
VAMDAHVSESSSRRRCRVFRCHIRAKSPLG